MRGEKGGALYTSPPPPFELDPTVEFGRLQTEFADVCLGDSRVSARNAERRNPQGFSGYAVSFTRRRAPHTLGPLYRGFEDGA